MPKLNTFISPFRLVAVLLYVGVIISKVIREAAHSCTKPVVIENDILFLSFLLILIGLEFYEQRYYPVRPTLQASIVFLTMRVILIELVRMSDCSFFYAFLYLLPPLISFRYFNQTIGFIFSIIYSINYSIRQYLLWGFVESVDEMLIFSLGLVFGIAMINLLEQEEKSRQHAERLLNELAASQQQVAELAATEERNRLARNIHDSVGHYLAVVGIQLDKAIAYKEIDGSLADEAILHAKRAADSALEDVRYSVSSLRDEDTFSLDLALRNLAQTSSELAIDLSMQGQETRYSRAVLTTLFRAVQEGLTNIHKHAQASRVNIEVVLGLNEAHLRVADDGQGFDTARMGHSAADPHAHFGLQGLKERLELVGGQLQIKSQLNQGTVLQVTIPRRELNIS